MKFFVLFISACFCNVICEAQVLKKLSRRIKADVEWRVHHKAGNKVDQGIDSLLEIPKKIINKKETKAQKSTGTSTPSTTETAQKKDNTTKPTEKAKPVAADSDDLQTTDGHVTLALSAERVFTGGTLQISGESVNYKAFNSVEITVKGPTATDVRKVALTKDGKYTAQWNAPDLTGNDIGTGNYTVIVVSPDKKASQSAGFTVEEVWEFAADWPEENNKTTKKAYDKLEEAVDKIRSDVGSKDGAELDKKLAAVKEKVDGATKLFAALNTAAKEVAALQKSGKKMPLNLSAYLSDLNNKLDEHAHQMKTFENLKQHAATGNTVCENIVMVNEACAAFSTFSNLMSGGVTAILKSIVLDKGLPKVVETINKGRLPSDAEWSGKQTSKIFATSLTDAESLTSKMGKAGFTGDLVQYASDVVLKKYCGLYKGDLKHDYTVIFRNSKGEVWWKYSVEVQSAFTLRYPKDKSSGSVIKMKGNLEGNGTRFTFYQNVAVEDDFKSVSKAKLEVLPLRIITPVAVPVATSQNDALGFGAVARGAFTPAYFNIPVDVEYNTDDEKLKLFLNSPIIDFSPAVRNQFIFLLIGPDLLPYFKRMDFPIHKIHKTLSSVMHKHDEFDVTKDSKGNLFFTGKAAKHLGSKTAPIEHFLNFSITAKKE